MRLWLAYRFGRSAGFRRRGSLGKFWKVLYLQVGPFEVELAARSGWGYSVWAWTGPRGYRRAWPGCSTYSEMERMRKKKKAEEGKASQHVAALESELFVKLHSLVAHCAVTQYDDGDRREPGWFSVRTFGSVWQVEIKDPDTCQSMRVQQPTLDDALLLAALLLDSEDAPWEHDPWLASKKRPKSKK